jgi:chromosome partitioning protein
METIAVISQKGGSGKTTTVINVAVAAQEAGQSVLVIDLDPQASATHWHRARCESLGEGATPHVQPTHPAGLAAVLKAANAQGVDWVFIDTAPQTDSNAVAAIEAANHVLAICRTTIVDLRAIMNTIRLCRLRDATPHVVLTQFEPQGPVRTETTRTLEEMDVSVLHEGLGHRIAYQHAMIDGQGVTEYDPSGKASAEVRALYKSLCHLASMPARRHAGSVTMVTRLKAFAARSRRKTVTA